MQAHVGDTCCVWWLLTETTWSENIISWWWICCASQIINHCFIWWYRPCDWCALEPERISPGSSAALRCLVPHNSMSSKLAQNSHRHSHNPLTDFSHPSTHHSHKTCTSYHPPRLSIDSLIRVCARTRHIPTTTITNIALPQRTQHRCSGLNKSILMCIITHWCTLNHKTNVQAKLKHRVLLMLEDVDGKCWLCF